jgi:S-formylglutathione hydrolase FrmB
MGWQRETFTSEALRGNPLGDPHDRALHVYAPDDGSRRYPSVYVLQSLGNTIDDWFDAEPGSVSYPDRISELAPEAVVVLVDAATAVGGSQYVDSSAIGNYHAYLCDELVPYVDAHYPTLPEARHRGVQGKSSGGFGAMITPLLRPDLFGGLATHAGDALFAVTNARDFATAARALRDGAGSELDEAVLASIRALAAAFSAGALPFDLETGEPIDEVWQQWLRWDPVLLARDPSHRDTLRNLRAVWIDAGRNDEFFLDLAAGAFHREVAAAGTPDDRVRFELFDGTHRGLTWRYPLSLAFLVEALSITL